MSPKPKRPLDKAKARKEIARLVDLEKIVWTFHAKERAKSRQLTEMDALNVLKSPRSHVAKVDWDDKYQDYSYSLETENLGVSVCIKDNLLIVTIYRRKS
jgi:hypothetical protein